MKFSRVIFSKEAGRVAAAGAALSVWCGCYAFTGVDAGQKAAAKKIGVVALLDIVEGPERRDLGRAVLPTFTEPGGGSGVDRAANEAAVRTLQAGNPGAQVVDLRREAESIRWDGESKGAEFPFVQHAHVEKALEEGARRLGTKYGVNIVVFVAPWYWNASQDGPGMPGCGYWARGAFGLHYSDAMFYANYGVGAYDGATGKQLAFRIGHINKKVEPGVPWQKSPEAYSASERSLLANTANSLVSEDVPKKIRSMKMAP